MNLNPNLYPQMDPVAFAATLESDVLLASGGDHPAFQRLVNGCARTVTSIITAIVRDPGVAEDIGQDVFLACWKDLHTLRNPAAFLPWIRQIARNHANAWLRETIRKRGIETQAADLLAESADPAGNLEARYEHDQDIRVLYEVIEALPDESREVVLLYYREEQSTAHVGRLLGLRENAVRKRLSRARNMLRDSLLTQFGKAASRTAPSTAFTASVMAGLASYSPPAAAAMSSKVVSEVAGSSILGKLGAALLAAVPGFLLGLLGVAAGVRLEQRRTSSAEERREWTRIGILAGAAVAFCVLGLSAAAVWNSRWLGLGAYAGFTAALMYLYGIRGRALTRARRTRELAMNPNAAQRHRRERILICCAWVFGVGTGWATLLYVLFWLPIQAA